MEAVRRSRGLALMLFTALSSAAVAQPASSPLSLSSATALALRQASAFRQAQIDERLAAEDVKQARSALLPRARDAFSTTYNAPAHRPQGGVDPTVPSFIAANAVHEYQNLLGVTGDLNYGLFAAVTRSRALLRAAHAGTEIARRALVRSVIESYYGAALATSRRRAAGQNLAAAEEFERITDLNYRAGEVPEVDAIRARLQTAARRDDLAQAIRDEAIASATLATLLGSEITKAPAIEELPQTIDRSDVNAVNTEAMMRRPEFAQLDAEVQAARADVKVARGDLLPRIAYSLDEGFDTSSLERDELRQHRGVLATASVDVPIFEWGAARSRVRQAQLRAESADTQRQLTVRELQLELAIARQDALSAAERVEIARTAVADAEKNATISVAQYRAGEAPVNVATEAQATLAAQRLVLQQALYDYHVAVARLREAAGQ